MVVAKEVQTFVRACEHLLSMPTSAPLSDIESDLVDYYIQELTNKYGVQINGKVGLGSVTLVAETGR